MANREPCPCCGSVLGFGPLIFSKVGLLLTLQFEHCSQYNFMAVLWVHLALVCAAICCCSSSETLSTCRNQSWLRHSIFFRFVALGDFQVSKLPPLQFYGCFAGSSGSSLRAIRCCSSSGTKFVCRNQSWLRPRILSVFGLVVTL